VILLTKISRMIVVALTAFLMCSAAMAVPSDEESKRLIQSYVDAVETGDLGLIKTAWNNLNGNPEAVEYMRVHYPKLNYLFEVRGLYFEMDKIEEQYAKEGAPLSEQAVLELQKNQVSPSQEVAPFSVSQPEADPMPTNGEIVARHPNSVERTNQDAALGNPNQNRLGNEKLIKSRTDAFYENKFQQAPQVLVPRGGDETASP
jgi:hypothetical protein